EEVGNVVYDPVHQLAGVAHQPVPGLGVTLGHLALALGAADDLEQLGVNRHSLVLARGPRGVDMERPPYVTRTSPHSSRAATAAQPCSRGSARVSASCTLLVIGGPGSQFRRLLQPAAVTTCSDATTRRSMKVRSALRRMR